MKRTSRQLLDTVDRALSEVERKLKSGAIDGSGRFYTEKELRAGAATGRFAKKPVKKPQEPAA